MKLNRIITLCAMTAALALSVSDLLAQDTGAGNNNGGGQGGGQRRNRGGQQGGQQGGPGGGNFDPAAMQQRMLDRYQQSLDFTNDTEWDAVKPLVQKVVEAQMAERSGQMRGMFGGRNRGGQQGGQGGQQGGRGGFGGQPNPEADALQKAIDDNAPSSQIKDLLAKYKTSQKAKQAKLEAAQANLKAVLTTKQEAQATLLGLVQ
jgi:hypothetical protein